MKLIGKFSVYNVLASIAATAVSGSADETSMITSIEEINGVSGRFEPVNAGQDFSVIVDYAHTPDSLRKCVKNGASICQKTHICCRWMWWRP